MNYVINFSYFMNYVINFCFFKLHIRRVYFNNYIAFGVGLESKASNKRLAYKKMVF